MHPPLPYTLGPSASALKPHAHEVKAPLPFPSGHKRSPSPFPKAEVLAAARRTLEDRFAARNPKSLALWERAGRRLPGGVTHDNRHTGSPGLYVTRAQGARKTDADGHAYIDYWVGHGSLLLGHGRREVVEAIQRASAELTHPGACHEREVLWAERVCALVPSAESVRFTASGSEATALAVRLARALTGKDTIVKFEGHFHGWLDHAVEGVDLPFEEPWSRGVPEALRPLTCVLPSGDLEAVSETLARRGDVAAVILEPTGASGGTLPLRPGFLADLRELCTRHGVLLIFDEVITGFRVAPGGAQERFGIRPDLTCLAKILAGGMPGGAVCGPLSSFAPMRFSGDTQRDRRRRVTQYGTFNAAPVCAAAGCAALARVEGGAPCREAEAFAAALRARLNALFQAEDAPFAAYGFSSIFHLFSAEPASARGLRDGLLSAADLRAEVLKKKGPLDPLLRQALLLEGVDLPAGRQAWTSAAHGEEELAETLSAFSRALGTLRSLGCL